MTTSAKPAQPKRRNSAFQRLMSVHWWMAICYLILFVTGPIMSRLPNDFPSLGLLYSFHKSVAVGTLLLLVWRIVTLVQVWGKKYARRFPKQTAHWWQKTLLHTGLYVLMVGVPLTGFFLSNSFKANGVNFFGLPVPDLFPVNADRLELGYALHFWSSYGFLLVVVYHTFDQWHYVRATWRRWQSTLDRRRARS